MQEQEEKGMAAPEPLREVRDEPEERKRKEDEEKRKPLNFAQIAKDQENEILNRLDRMAREVRSLF